MRRFLDSIAPLKARLDSLGGDRAAAPILFRLGQLKRHADRWMYTEDPAGNTRYSCAPKSPMRMKRTPKTSITARTGND